MSCFIPVRKRTFFNVIIRSSSNKNIIQNVIWGLKILEKRIFKYVGAPYYNCRGSKGAGVLFNMSLSNGRVAAAGFLFFIVQVFLHTGSFHVYKIHFLTVVDPVSNFHKLRMYLYVLWMIYKWDHLIQTDPTVCTNRVSSS